MSNSKQSIIIASAAYIVMHSCIRKKNKRDKRWWVKQLYKSREIYSGSTLLEDLKFQEISGQFQNFVRMSSQDFELLINMIGPKITKLNTRMRMAVPVKERLAITLRFLATGDSYTSMQYLFKVSKQLISSIVPETCRALIEVLKKYVKMPSSPEEWLLVAEQYEELWNFPNCLGAMDGKHIALQAPINSGSEYYNYKSHFSIVLFALVDANYNFIFADTGCQGRISDGGVFKHSTLHKRLQSNDLNIPTARSLPGRNQVVEYVFLGDEAFPLCKHIMKPFSGTHQKGSMERIFNYLLSRARRIVENVFGISSAVFRILRKPMLLEPEKAELVVMTIVLLHNFLRRNKQSRTLYNPTGTFDADVDGQFVPGNWRETLNEKMSSLIPIRTLPRKSPKEAQDTRKEFAAYFTSNGRICWQDQYA
ncbi:uncharacterized protein [Leptinotarsa decemlineata]|uniref:uncharacterized protein n=1 Tax=Leptinotarsa decemlineata TaxID=7539 RepID=UPI003D30BCB8